MNILLQVSNHKDACAFYRTLGPYSLLAKKHKEVNLFTHPNFPHWSDIRRSDVLILSRPMSMEMVMVAKSAIDFNVPIVVDMDDDFFCIPKDNPVHSIFTDEKLKYVETVLRMATLITVSTEHLKLQLSRFNNNIVVIPNALDDALIQFKHNIPSNKLVLWRGSRTHEGDVETVENEIVEVAKKNPEYCFCFLGADPRATKVSDKISNVKRILDPLEPMYFYQTMISLRPKIIITPLCDNKFNKSKSNIAAIEGALSGAVCLAPNWDEWQLPGVYKYNDPKDFKEKLDWLINEPNTNLFSKKTWDYIIDNLTLSEINKKRLRELNKIIK